MIRKFLTNCDNKEDNHKAGKEVEELWSDFKELVKIMENWVRNTAKEIGSRQYEFIDKDIENSRFVTSALIKKNEAWKRYSECKNQVEKDARWRYFKWKRNIAKKALRRRISERNKKLIKEIESIKTQNPGEFWRQLRKLGKSKGRKTVWDTAIDEEGVEVAGERIKLV